MYIPKVAAIHDLSCLGRCSLSVIVPILSKLHAQVCPLPTAVLSSHFGGFNNISMVDCTDTLNNICRAWTQEKIKFDCIYTGFLASPKQITPVKKFFQTFAQDALVLVDPVMGDNGRLYSHFTEEIITVMKQLIPYAEIITPNYTEACLLLGKPYQPLHKDVSALLPDLNALANQGPKRVVITGIHLTDGRIANIAYDSDTGEYFTTYAVEVPISYPGTGDVFTAVLLGYLLLGFNMSYALDNATKFITECIRITLSENTPVREGVLLETALEYIGTEGFLEL